METLANKTIGFLYRKKLPQNNSIEELFGTIENELLERGLEIKSENLFYSRVSLTTLIKNLKQVSTFNYDVLHITGDVQYAALTSKIPAILTVHDVGSAIKGSLFKQIIIKLFWFWIPALVLKKITVISEFSRNELEEIIPFAKHKIVVIPNPVNKKLKFKPQNFNEKYPTILHIGTKENKNLERTIESISGLKCKLVVIGKLSESQERLLIDKKIDFENEYFIDYNRIIEHYENCDLVCFVSTYEGFGMPIIEAQRIGRPVVTSKTASMPEVAGHNACLVDPYNVSEIRNALIKIIENKNYRDKLIESGLKNSDRFSVNKVTEKYIEVYKDVLGLG